MLAVYAKPWLHLLIVTHAFLLHTSLCIMVLFCFAFLHQTCTYVDINVRLYIKYQCGILALWLLRIT